MEGYANINASHHDFDDLDIEGRPVSEWSQEDDYTLDIEGDVQKKRILETKVRVDDGTLADMCSIVKKQHGFSYTCHVCMNKFNNWKEFNVHLGCNKHLNNMRLSEHPKHKFVKLDPKADLSLEPGEPVPPGFEDSVISTCQIQPIIDNYHAAPLIGLEYLVELTGDFDDEPEYVCMLCDKIGKDRSILGHMSSQGHFRKYLEAFFKNAVKLYSDNLPRNAAYRKRVYEVILRIARKIEKNYGRLKPRSERASSFESRKAEVMKEIESGIHFREGADDRYDDCLLLTDPSPLVCVSVNKRDLNAPLIKEEVPVAQTKKVPEESKTFLPETKPIDTSDIKEDDGKSLFNKGKINAEKRQLRPRDEVKAERKSSSPEIVSVEIAPPSAKKLKKSKSPSVSSISSTSSHSRSKSRSKSRSHDRSRTRSRVRSPYGKYKGRSPYRPRYRSRSRNRSYDKYSRRSRSHSPHRYRPRRYSRSRGKYHSRSPSRSRSPSYSDKFGRSIKSRVRGQYSEKRLKEINSKYNNEGDDFKNERIKWEKFRVEFNEMETELFEKLKYFEKNPEKHPQYPEEWKVFWNKRYKEIQAEGKDPAKHDFKPEWIVYWTGRMKEIHEEDLVKKREILKNKLGLPTEKEPKPYYMKQMNESPPVTEKKDAIADIKQTWKNLTGSDIKESKRPLSPWEEETKTTEETSDQKNQQRPRKRHLFVDTATSVVSILRKLCVLEDALGSLGPRVLELLTVALKMDKETENGSEKLLENNEHCVFLETAKEKLKGLLFAGVVARNLVNTARIAIRTIEQMLKTEAPKATMYSNKPLLHPVIIKPITKPIDPVSVPGVGKVDKVAIAQQIASALIQQGRTNVTEDELEQLINAVVGMAEASSNSSQPISTAAYVSQLANAKEEPQVKSTPSGLTLLQSAYDEVPKPDPVDKISGVDNKSPKSNVDDLSELDLKNLVHNFNELSDDEKKGLKRYLNKLENKSPEIIKQLKPIIPEEILVKPIVTKSPIVIPIAKEKSDQKIKPVQEESGRLSPFSMRSGGVNPTPDSANLELSKTMLTSLSKAVNDSDSHSVLIDNEEDDDDDDYSFEDVYKAASEKLRLKQVEEEKRKLSEEPDDVTIVETLSSGDEMSKTSKNYECHKPDVIKVATEPLSTEPKIPNPSDYQVNANNFTPFVPNKSRQPGQDFTQMNQGGNFPADYNQQSTYSSDVPTIPGLDSFSKNSNNIRSDLPMKHNIYNPPQASSFQRNVTNSPFPGRSVLEPSDPYLNRNAQRINNVEQQFNISSSQSRFPAGNMSSRDLPSNDLNNPQLQNRSTASNYFQGNFTNRDYSYQPGLPSNQGNFNRLGETRYPAPVSGNNIPYREQAQSFTNRGNDAEYYRNQNYYDTNNPAYGHFNHMPRY